MQVALNPAQFGCRMVHSFRPRPLQLANPFLEFFRLAGPNNRARHFGPGAQEPRREPIPDGEDEKRDYRRDSNNEADRDRKEKVGDVPPARRIREPHTQRGRKAPSRIYWAIIRRNRGAENVLGGTAGTAAQRRRRPPPAPPQRPPNRNP